MPAASNQHSPNYQRPTLGTCRHVVPVDAHADDGFTLVEVLVATAIFVFVAVAGFETLRQLGLGVGLLAQRAGSAASLNTALGQLRDDAVSAAAIWTPSAPCGAAVSMMRRDAAGTSFTTYVARNNAILRATAPGPIDPCDPTLTLDTVLPNVPTVSATSIPVSALVTHVDPVSGNSDGGLVRNSAPAIAVDAHERDYDGSHVLAGNAIVEVTIDADPAQATIDLIAGNRPSGYTNVLSYACGSRCAANTVFPEIAGLDFTTCTMSAPDLPDTSAFYTPSATGVGAAGRIVTTAYAVHLRYTYTFDGGSSAPLTVSRVGPVVTWPAAANLSDAYPADYTNNAVRSTGPAALAALFGPPPNLATNGTICAGMNAEVDFRG